MKDFESRWNAALGAARSAPPREETTAPHGFATRIVALRQQTERGPSAGLLWLRLTWRALGFAVLLLAASAALNFTGPADSALEPAIVDSMNDLLWLP